MKLYSNIHGEDSNPALIVMHGVFGMGDNWQTLGRKWAADYWVHLLDMRNHGKSPHSEEFSYEVMAADLLEYMDDQQIEKAIILGHSMGGKVGMLFATLHPDKVHKLIVADIAPKPYDPHHGPITHALQSMDFSNISSRREAEEAFAEYIDNPGIRQFLLKSLYWKDRETLAWRFNVPVIAREVAKSGEGLPPNAIYQGDTLFIRGGKSSYILDEDWDEIESHFPNAELKTIEGAGHWLHAEKPRDFYEALQAFIRD